MGWGDALADVIAVITVAGARRRGELVDLQGSDERVLSVSHEVEFLSDC